MRPGRRNHFRAARAFRLSPWPVVGGRPGFTQRHRPERCPPDDRDHRRQRRYDQMRADRPARHPRRRRSPRIPTTPRNGDPAMSEQLAFAVIGGSGLYSMKGLSDTKEHVVKTPFGKPSSSIITGTLEGQRVAFLARHGVGHYITPTEVNYRANIYALKSLGATRIVGINACGSLREDYAPGQIVIPDQIYDNTKDRARTFFGEGLVAHVSVADPFCADLSTRVFEAVKATGGTVHKGGAFVVIEGPRFSTRAESGVFRAWGMSIIGMTAAPEAF